MADIIRPVAWIGLLLASALLHACGVGDDGDAVPATRLQANTDLEFKRRLRLGVEQLRRHLPESARAEFAACARLRPDDPELLFQQARLILATAAGPADSDAAIALLQRVVALQPASVKGHRLLYDLETRRRNQRAARTHHQGVVGAYGQMGETEIASFANYRAGSSPNLKLAEARKGAKSADDLRRFRAAALGLYRNGSFAPSRVVPVIEGILAKYPDLAAVRLYYAKMLVLGEIRVDYSNRPGTRPMASAPIFDTAQTELERVYDQIHPGSPMARDVIYMLSQVAMLMADYDESIAMVDLLLQNPRVQGDLRRFQLGRKAVALLKQERYTEAVALFEESLAGAGADFGRELAHLWLLHLAHEGLGTPPEERKVTFRFRKDLAMPGDPTPLLFEDVATEYGIDKHDGLGPSAWGDYDRDGDYDLFVTGSDSYGALYRNDGDRFTDVSREAKLFHVQSGFSATWSDYDNNGWIDLHVGRDGWNGPIANSFFVNNGDGTFAETTDSVGLGNPGSSFVCQWSDYDRDGDVDLYVSNGITGGGDTNVLYRNNLDGTFTDVTIEAGLKEPPGIKTIGNCWGDFNDDGWPDLFVSGYKTANRLYRNNGNGTFANVAAEVGLLDDQLLTTGYTCFFLDYDNDLDLDILRPALAPFNDVLLGLSDRYGDLPAAKKKEMLQHGTRLYRNEGNGTFTDVSVEAGFIHPNGAMGTGVADLDNDGYLDIYFGTGDPAIERMEPDRLYRNNGNGSFTDLTFAAGVANVGKGHGETFVDIDLDGDLEIYAPEGGFVHGDPFPNAFYLNLQESGNHWIHIDLEGTKSNRDALDTRILVTAGGRTLLREKHNGEGFGSSNSPPVEFGLGKATTIDEIEIRWPMSDPEIFTDIPVDRRISIREGEGKWTEMK